MSLTKLRDPTIDPSTPWSGDVLGRQREGQLLSRLITSMSATNGCVVAVYGPWGSGKTVFFKRLAAQLELDFVPVVLLDAWRADYLSDPLLAFLAALTQRLEKRYPKSSGDRAREVITQLAKHGAKLIAPVASLLTGSFIPGASSTIAGISAAVGKIGTLLLDWEREQRSAEVDFKKALESARDLLTGRDAARPVKPIVIIVDELDRCKPTFSIATLERIKHYFDVPGVIFVIGSDGANLPNAVHSVYGPSVVGEAYLRKFFDYEYRLEKPDPQHFISVLTEQFEFTDLLGGKADADVALHAYKTTDGYEDLLRANPRSLDASEIISVFPVIASALGLSLRDQGQVFTHINAYLRSIPRDTVIYSEALIYSVCMKFSQPEVYARLLGGGKILEPLLADKEFHFFDRETPGERRNPVSESLSLFAAAQRETNAQGYIFRILESSEGNRDRPHLANAARRLAARAGKGGAANIQTYLSRALKLAEAFS